MNISPYHFTRISKTASARQLFKASVHQVEIETHSYCNRVCWFCPNSKLDRRSANHRMDEALYLRIIRELASIDYSGAITYSRYNEPLADRIILKRIRQAREALPKATIFTHTNGDYLTLEYLEELREAGLNKLRVQVYLGANDRYDDAAMVTRIERRLTDLGLPWEYGDFRPNFHYMARVEYEGIDVQFEASNFEASGLVVDRGQTLSLNHKFERLAPCLIPFHSLYIDWNGSIVPCCNIRSDEPTHAPYIVDNIASGRSIFLAYADSALVEWRKSLSTSGPKKAPCNTCAYEP